MRIVSLMFICNLFLGNLLSVGIVPHPQPDARPEYSRRVDRLSTSPSKNLERGARSLINSVVTQQTAYELQLSRVIDTGKVIIPKPKVLDDLPDEYHITGQLVDEKDNSAILFVEIYVFIDGKEFAKGGTDKSGNFRLIFQRKNMTAAAAKKILGGDIDFTIKLWGKDLSKFDFRDNFPVPIIEFIESQGFRYFHKDTLEFENQILLAYNRDFSGEEMQYNLFAKAAKSGKK